MTLSATVRGIEKERAQLLAALKKCATRCDALQGELENLEQSRRSIRERIAEIDTALAPLRGLRPTEPRASGQTKPRRTGAGEAVLNAMGDKAMSLAEVAEATGLPKQTAQGAIVGLMHGGKLERAGSGRYRRAA